MKIYTACTIDHGRGPFGWAFVVSDNGVRTSYISGCTDTDIYHANDMAILDALKWLNGRKATIHPMATPKSSIKNRIEEFKPVYGKWMYGELSESTQKLADSARSKIIKNPKILYSDLSFFSVGNYLLERKSLFSQGFTIISVMLITGRVVLKNFMTGSVVTLKDHEFDSRDFIFFG